MDTTTRIIIPCPHCASRNRLPAERRGQGKCGTCHQPLFTGKPVVLTAANFDAHAGAGDLPLVADFWATWCGPCRAMAPVFEALAAEYEPRVRFGKLDTDAEQTIAARFQIRSIPTLILFHGGREIARQSGALPPQVLRQWLDGNLG